MYLSILRNKKINSLVSLLLALIIMAISYLALNDGIYAFVQS
jgi:hypothetical protein